MLSPDCFVIFGPIKYLALKFSVDSYVQNKEKSLKLSYLEHL